MYIKLIFELVPHYHLCDSTAILNSPSSHSSQIHGTSLKARKLVVRVCAIVIRRAARLVAAGIVAILKKTGRDGSQGKPRRTVIAFESVLYMHYPIFLTYINEAIKDILGEEVAQNIVLQISQEDGSAIGTAMLAAVCSTPR